MKGLQEVNIKATAKAATIENKTAAIWEQRLQVWKNKHKLKSQDLEQAKSDVKLYQDSNLERHKVIEEYKA